MDIEAKFCVDDSWHKKVSSIDFSAILNLLNGPILSVRPIIPFHALPELSKENTGKHPADGGD